MKNGTRYEMPDMVEWEVEKVLHDLQKTARADLVIRNIYTGVLLLLPRALLAAVGVGACPLWEVV